MKIHYFSDLFIAVMVIAWIIQIGIETWAAIYATITLGDLTVWAEVGELVQAPLTAGGAIWMIKNSVQHYLANKDGKQAPMDFPKVDDTEIEKEELCENKDEKTQSGAKG